MQDLLNKPVNPAWPLGARREIKLMSEDQILDVKGGSSWHLPAIVVLGLIALVGLAFGWSASSKLDSTQQAVATQLKQAQQSMQQDMSRSEEHTSELQSRRDLVCRLLLEKKKKEKERKIKRRSHY